MPFDGKTYEPKMSLEEQALRNADAFFTGPEKWHRGSAYGRNGSMCLGRAIISLSPRVLKLSPPRSIGTFLGLGDCSVSEWNDRICPSYAAMKALLKGAIARLERERTKELVA